MSIKSYQLIRLEKAIKFYISYYVLANNFWSTSSTFYFYWCFGFLYWPAFRKIYTSYMYRSNKLSKKTCFWPIIAAWLSDYNTWLVIERTFSEDQKGLSEDTYSRVRMEWLECARQGIHIDSQGLVSRIRCGAIVSQPSIRRRVDDGSGCILAVWSCVFITVSQTDDDHAVVETSLWCNQQVNTSISIS